MTEHEELFHIIETIENGHQAFLGQLAAATAGRKLINESLRWGLTINYISDFTPDLITVMQLLNIRPGDFLQAYEFEGGKCMIVDCISVCQELTGDLELSLAKLKQAKAYTDISSGQKWDYYVNELTEASNLVQNNFRKLSYL